MGLGSKPATPHLLVVSPNPAINFDGYPKYHPSLKSELSVVFPIRAYDGRFFPSKSRGYLLDFFASKSHSLIPSFKISVVFNFFRHMSS